MTARAGVVLAFVLSGCAARGPSPQLVADAGKAEALLREGCYACLKDALAIFERIGAAPRPVANARARAFETALLIHLREKELGLPAEASLARARELAARVPASPPASTPRPPASGNATAAPTIAPATLLDAAALIVGETAGIDPPQRLLLRKPGAPPPATTPERQALDALIASNLTAAYLAISIDCEDLRKRAVEPVEDILKQHGDVALLRYRAATCIGPRQNISTLREEDPRWLDTLLFEGRRELIGLEVDVEKAVRLFTQAHETFPTSLAITLALANGLQNLADFEQSLAKFDLVLATATDHRDGLLGRTTTLSYMTRHKEAIVSASRLIELGTWHIGDAYYWRAWNRYQLQELDPAWQDVEQARKLLSNTSVYMLAGLIEYGRKQPETAILRLDRAYALDNTNCEAAWFASLVHTELQQWPLATPKFARSLTCFTKAAADARAQITRIAASNASQEVKDRRTAAQQKIIDTAEHRAAQSAFNAAQGFLRGGDKAQALVHLDIAEAHPLLREKAAAVRKTIER